MLDTFQSDKGGGKKYEALFFRDIWKAPANGSYGKARLAGFLTDPLVCPKCSGEMDIIRFIDQAKIIIHAKRNSIAH